MPKIKKIYVGTNLVRPKWKPSANTVAYYPLNGNTNDYSGNGRNLTVSSGTMSYGNLTDRQYGSFAGSTVLTTTSIVTLGVGTLCMWTNYSDVGCPFAFTQNTNNSSNYATYASLGTYNGGDRLFAMYTESTSDRLAITSQTYPRNTRILYTLTNNGGTLSYYKNGTFIQSASLSSFLNKSSANMRCVGGGKRGSQTFSLHKGGISEIIIENVCRAAENISNYYNTTKGKYGIS